MLAVIKPGTLLFLALSCLQCPQQIPLRYIINTLPHRLWIAAGGGNVYAHRRLDRRVRRLVNDRRGGRRSGREQVRQAGQGVRPLLQSEAFPQRFPGGIRQFPEQLPQQSRPRKGIQLCQPEIRWLAIHMAGNCFCDFTHQQSSRRSFSKCRIMLQSIVRRNPVSAIIASKTEFK